ncbi:MAG: hypothetical protein Q8O56_04085 [Solirubrobacteraceae bacterium]|nr:hypothetical protein [Solirubrobacteraceae bacterium]
MAQREGVTFEIERLELEGDELVVSGFWSGVRGLRFVRPTLLSDEHRILATLEHKPWAPSPEAAWTAAFPWNGGDVDIGKLALAVGSQVTVPLGAGTVVEAAPALAPASAPAPADGDTDDAADAGASPPAAAGRSLDPALAVVPTASRADDAETAHDDHSEASDENELDAVVRERDALRRRLEDAELLTAERERRAVQAAKAAAQEEIARHRASADRDRDRALAQLAEAVEAREAAVRSRTRIELAADEALRARDDAENALDQAKSERDEAKAQRDEVLVAYHTLQRSVQRERAQEDRERGAAAGASGDDGDAGDSDETSAPIGVRTIPSARTVMADLQHPRREAKLVLSQFDLWVIRVLGTVAAGCFILLLLSILRVFI